ncbi:hypothetical protein C8R45DRAFT_1133492, partial [Mycena sanguinolenta]
AHDGSLGAPKDISSELALSEPRLPPELEHVIFKITALAHPVGIPTLMLVARRVKFWVQPILYRVVFFLVDSTIKLYNLGLPTFTPDLIKQKSHDFLHVRNLFIHDLSVGDTVLKSWLMACTGITNLYAQARCTPETLPSLSDFTNVQYLTINVHALCGTTIPVPLFLAVTHLELLAIHIGIENVPSLCRNIPLIPRLTHIALNPQLDSLLSHAALCAVEGLNF